MRAGQEREQGPLVLAVPVAQLGQHQRGERMKRIGGRDRGGIRKLGDAQGLHGPGLGAGPAIDPDLQVRVGNIEHGADEGAGAAGRLHERHVLETALDLGPLAPLSAVGAGQAVLEGKVLQRDHEDRQP